MKKGKQWRVVLLISCLFMAMITTKAADGRIGLVVDGSMLMEGDEVIGKTKSPEERGTYLSSGTGRLTKKGTGYVNVWGDTSCNRTSDEVKVTLYLQRLVGSTWKTVYTLGPKTASNTGYVSNSKNYTVTGGYYYRVKGTHSAKKGSTTETTASYTDGLWID